MSNGSVTPVAIGMPNSSRFSVCRVTAALPLMVGSRSARRWPDARVGRAARRAGRWPRSTPWLRPSVIAWRSVSGPCGTTGCLRGGAGAAASDEQDEQRASGGACALPQLRSAGRASTPWRYRSMSPSTACSSVSACGSKAWKKHCTLGGVHQQRGQAARREAVRAGPELAGGDAALEHLLDQPPGAENHLVKVEPGQLGEVHQLTLDHPGDPHHLLARACGRTSGG